MYVHYFLKKVHANNQGLVTEEGMSLYAVVKRRVFAYQRNKPFYYNIAGQNYTLEDIKHGLFRMNRRKPGYMMRLLNTNDHRLVQF